MGKKMLMRKFGGAINCSDADGIAFLTAAGITDATEQSAVCQLVTDLKTYGIWSKCIGIYPFLGGEKAKAIFNLKDTTRNLSIGSTTDVYTKGWYSKTAGSGASTGYLATNLTLNNTHISVYSRTDINSSNVYDFQGGNIQFFSRLSNLMLCDMYTTTGSARVAKTNTNSIGFNVASRTLPDRFELFKNGISLGFANNSGGSLLTADLAFGNSVSGDSIKREYAFASFGLGLTAVEVANFNTSVLLFCTTLGRDL